MIVNTRGNHATPDDAHAMALASVDPHYRMWHEVEFARALANDNTTVAYVFAVAA